MYRIKIVITEVKGKRKKEMAYCLLQSHKNYENALKVYDKIKGKFKR